MTRTIALVFAIFLQVTTASANPYYAELIPAKEKNIKQALHKILKSGHIKNPGSDDEIVASCSGQTNCIQHTSYGYDRARAFLFGKFYLVPVEKGQYGIKEMYCDRVYQKEDFSKGNQPGVNSIPDATIMNVEHTWPQSKFTKQYPKDLQKSDLHHLFPTDSVMNSLRGNNIFGEVDHDAKDLKCEGSRYGFGTAGSERIFEPPDSHKGNVARALFYFSVRYEIPITHDEEIVLKKWNQEYPVDEEEMNRNNEIEKVQFNRNPFIDFPDLADQISDF